MARDARWNGIIRQPGKFEGEPVAVRYYWNGDGEDHLFYADDGETQIRVFTDVTDDPFLPHLCLYESCLGFVYHEFVDDGYLAEKC